MPNPFKQPFGGGTMPVGNLAPNQNMTAINSIRSFFNNPENKQQIQALWKEYQTNPNAFYRRMIANNPTIQNNPICNMLLSGGVNPDTILMQSFGISQHDIAGILN